MASMPFNFCWELINTPLDESEVELHQTLTQVHRVDYFNIKVHVRHQIMYLTRPQLQQPPETIPYFDVSSHSTTMLLSWPQFLENGSTYMRMHFPDSIIPHELMNTMMPEVTTYAKNLVENGRSPHDETSHCRLFNLVLDIEVQRLYDDVINMIMGESMRQVRMVPASKTAIESLKKVNLEEDMTMERCSICLEEFIEGMEVLAMPCNHMYHQECITQWLESSHTCPLCRYPMA